MTPLLTLIVGPLIAGALGLGTVPIPGPPPVSMAPTIQLSLVGGGVQAGQHLQVQALVTGIGGVHEHGTVTFQAAGSSMMVGSPLDAGSIASANLGIATTGPTTVDARFVPTGGSTVTATAEATFRGSPIPVTPFITVDPARAGSPVAVHFGLNLGPKGYEPGGHVDVMIGIASVRSGFCIPAPGGSGSLLGVWKCTAAIPPLPAGNVELHVVLNDSPYYSASKYLIVPVAAAPALTGSKAAPSTASSASAPPSSPPSPLPSPSATDSTGSPADAAAAGPGGLDPRLVTADGAAPATGSQNAFLLVLLAVVLAGLIVALLVVLRRVRGRAG